MAESLAVGCQSNSMPWCWSAPCSGEGTIRKDADAMKNWTYQSVVDIADTPKDLIESAFHALKPNGVLVYSTCTLSTEENQQVCHHLKETFGDAVEFESLENLFDNASDDDRGRLSSHLPAGL